MQDGDRGDARRVPPAGHGWRWERFARRGLLGLLLAGAPALFGAEGGPPSALPAGPVPETPQFRLIGTAEGLPSSRINGLAQDRRGYLWIATDDGLVRHDGTGFRTWRAEPGVVGGMPGNNVQTLFIDRDDVIWMGFDDGQLATLDAQRRTVRPLPALPGGNGALAWSMAQTRDGRLWISTFGAGLFRSDGQGGFEALGPVPAGASGSPQAVVFGMAEDAEGRLWIGTMAGMARVVDGRIESVAAGPLDAVPVIWINAEPDGSLWIGTRGERLWQRSPEGRFAPSPWAEALGDARVHGVLRDGRGGHWVHTARGLFYGDGGALRRFGTPLADEGDYQQALLDHQGGLWFGDAESGLLTLAADWRSFATLTRRGPSQLRLSMQQAKSFAELDDGRVLIGGEDGRVDRLDVAAGRIERGLFGPEQLGPGRVFALRQSADGSLWIGSGQLSRLDRQGRWQVWRSGDGPEPLLPGPVDHLLPLPDGTLWLASYGGGLQQRAADGRVLRELRPDAGKGLEAGVIEALLLGPDGQPWVANAQGLLRFDGERLQALPGLVAGAVEGLGFAPDGRLWTWSAGTLRRYRIGPEGLELDHEATPGNEGLPAAEAGGIAVDGHGRVWIASVRGLLRYDPTDRRLRRFGVADGLVLREFGLRPPLQLADGRLLLGAVGGALLFDPLRVAPDPRIAPLVLESVSVRRAEDLVELPPGSEVILQPEDRELRVAVRLMNFAEPHATRYRFRLNGHDPDWVEVGIAGERPLPRPAPGHYTLDIIAAGADGRWTPPLTLAITVPPPWWMTWWAFAAYGLLLLLFVLGTLDLLRRRLRAQAERRREAELRTLAQQASDAKTAFLADLGHELRTPLTGVLGMTELMLHAPLSSEQRERAETVLRAGQHLLRLVNDTLDLARIEAGRLPLEQAAFMPQAVLADVARLLRPQAEAKGLGFELRVAPGLAPRYLGDEARLRQMLLNLGSNALKFTAQGRVCLAVAAKEGGGLRFTVEDTGIGLDDNEQRRLFQRFTQAEGEQTRRRYGGLGLGLSISRELARAMGGELGLESRKGEGSRFHIDLPLPVAEDSEAAAPLAPVPGGTLRPLALLLVEDDPVVAQVLRGLLEARGHRVHHATQALQALTLLHTERIELGLLDIDLPAVDGFELARLIRAQGWILPLVAVSARADAESEGQALAAGMDAYLRKPVDGASLDAALAPFAGSVLRADSSSARAPM